MGQQSVQILGTGQLLELSRKLKAAGGARLKANFGRRVRRAAEPLRDDMRQTIRILPIKSDPRKSGNRGGPSPISRPLRATIAEQVRIAVRTSGNPGARVWLDKGGLPPGLPGVAEALNSKGRNRHPVFGNKRRWVQQTTTPLWWDRTVRAHTPRMTREIAHVLEDVRGWIE
ncbi:hypothetical protein [Streptomyces sp. NBC_00829]|uniref:hypothetical protein n=1 Tax=Streptomyces sp. NBC_00829 TaxID=2903679 RepID=UPI00386D81D6|nr:hypothetical protein OG293_23120 [Streptomyces sp. NBC_00829]